MRKEHEDTDRAFEHIYLKDYLRLKRFAQEYVLVEEDAENILQDVFLEFWEKREVLINYSNPSSFLFIAIKNRCINFLKRKTIERKISNHIQEEYIRTLQVNLESLECLDIDLSQCDSIQKQIHEAINALSPKCKQIFIMSKIEGKRQKDIATELNITVNSVETQMSIAYKKLRENLKAYYPMLLFFF